MIRTFVLILLLVGAVTWLLVLSVNPNRTGEPTPSATPSPAQSVLSMAEVSSTSSARTVNINIDTGNNKVTGVQLELSYDPEILENVDIEEGTFFENSVTLLKEINTEDGRVSYALAVGPGQGGIYGAGTVAVLTFTENEIEGITKIDFLPKTLVSGEGVIQSILKSSAGITLDL